MPSQSTIADFVQSDGSEPEHSILRKEQKNCETSGGALELLILNDYSVVIVGLQIYDGAGSARSFYWYF